MTLKYDILFRVNILHEYYSDSISADFDIVPTPSTQRLFDRMGLTFRPTPHGFNVFVRTDPENTTPTLFYSLDESQLHFSFAMILKNPHFINFTAFPNDTPPRLGREVLYFSNVNRQQADSPILGDSIGSGAYLQLINNHIYTLKYDSPISNASPILQDLFGNNYTPIPEINLPSAESTDELQIDFREIGQIRPGRYNLSDIPNSISLPIFYDPELNGQSVFGIIDIYNNTSTFHPTNTDLIAVNYKFLSIETLTRNNDDTLVADYRVEFENSSYQLFYLVHLKSDLTDTAHIPQVLSGLTLSSLNVAHNSPNGTTYDFTNIDSSSDPIIISSNDTDIPWLEAVENFELTRTDDDPNSADPADVIVTRIKTLPSPSVLLPIKRSGSGLIQEIHIYV